MIIVNDMDKAWWKWALIYGLMTIWLSYNLWSMPNVMVNNLTICTALSLVNAKLDAWLSHHHLKHMDKFLVPGGWVIPGWLTVRVPQWMCLPKAAKQDHLAPPPATNWWTLSSPWRIRIRSTARRSNTFCARSSTQLIVICEDAVIEIPEQRSTYKKQQL